MNANADRIHVIAIPATDPDQPVATYSIECQRCGPVGLFTGTRDQIHHHCLRHLDQHNPDEL